MRSSRLNKPTIAVTMGDAAGIGPEVTLKALSSRRLDGKKSFLVIGDGSALVRTAKLIKSRLPANLLDLKNINNFQFGKNQASCGRAAVQYIDKAVELLGKRKVAALVTAPVNKESINKAGIRFSGHTEYLAKSSGAKSTAMMFVAPDMRAVLVTTHLALRNVRTRLSKERIVETTVLASRFLKRFYRIKKPRIGITGLNPHAGDGGILGAEEKDIIQPAVDILKKTLPYVKGPLPADSAFYEAVNHKYDILVCMFHDQGMIPIKMLARNKAVNLTLGLPYVRTSPVHGTAFDIAGKGKADPSSMIEAMNLAAKLIKEKYRRL